ncbi:MAG: YoaK family protein [Acidimicrobiales bacterium]
MTAPARGVVLAAVGGYLDTLGYMMLSGLFVNHVTGNIVLAVAEPGRSSVPEIVMFPLFFAMVAFGTAVAARGPGIRAALTAEATFLGLFLVLGVVLIPEPGAASLTGEVVVGAAGVSAMAIQTAVTRLAGHAFPTNMVTGTMTMLGMDAARLLLHLDNAATERAATSRRARLHGRVVLGFAAGAAAAALVTSTARFWAGLIPLAVVGFLAALPITKEKEKETWPQSLVTTTSA